MQKRSKNSDPITLEALEGLENHRLELTSNQVDYLLATARELLELKGALEFLAKGKDLHDLWHQDDGYHAADPYLEEEATDRESASGALMTLAAGRGWTSPLQASEVPDGRTV